MEKFSIPSIVYDSIRFPFFIKLAQNPEKVQNGDFVFQGVFVKVVPLSRNSI